MKQAHLELKAHNNALILQIAPNTLWARRAELSQTPVHGQYRVISKVTEQQDRLLRIMNSVFIQYDCDAFVRRRIYACVGHLFFVTSSSIFRRETGPSNFICQVDTNIKRGEMKFEWSIQDINSSRNNAARWINVVRGITWPSVSQMPAQVVQ